MNPAEIAACLKRIEQDAITVNDALAALCNHDRQRQDELAVAWHMSGGLAPSARRIRGRVLLYQKEADNE